jgi:hypothetical protein
MMIQLQSYAKDPMLCRGRVGKVLCEVCEVEFITSLHVQHRGTQHPSEISSDASGEMSSSTKQISDQVGVDQMAWRRQH